MQEIGKENALFWEKTSSLDRERLDLLKWISNLE